MSAAVASSRHRSLSSAAETSAIFRPASECHTYSSPSGCVEGATRVCRPVERSSTSFLPSVSFQSALSAPGATYQQCECGRQSCRQEAESYLHRLVCVQIYVHAPLTRLAAQQADVLAVVPVVGYLLLGDPKRFPARASGILLAGRDRDYAGAALDVTAGGLPARCGTHARISNSSSSIHRRASSIPASGWPRIWASSLHSL